MKRKYKFIFLLLLICLIVFSFLKNHNKNYNTNYIITTSNVEAHINEIYKNGITSLNINIDESEFKYLIRYKGKQKIIEEISYIKDNKYKCLFLIFKNGETTNDLICKNKNDSYYSSSIDNLSEMILLTRKNLIERGLIEENVDDATEKEIIDSIEIYKNNLNPSTYYMLSSYKGLYIINKKNIKEVKLFEKDIYNQKLKQVINNKYIIADYNEDFDFKTFYIVDIKTGSVDKMNFNFEISFDSEIKYVSGNYLYLYDNDSKKTYKIDVNKKSIKTIKTIDYEEKNIEDYLIINQTNQKNNDYYYLLKNNKIYLSNFLDTKTFVYLKDHNEKNIKMHGNNLCWIEESNLVCYKQFIGKKTILKNGEFLFNKTVDYAVYSE